MTNKLLLLVILAIIAAAVAVPVEKEQTPVVDGQDPDQTTVATQDKDNTAGAEDQESEDIANRNIVYPVYPGYGPVYVQPGYVPVSPVVVQPGYGYVPVRPVVVQPGYVPVSPVVVKPGYVPVVAPGYGYSSGYSYQIQHA